MSLAVFAPAIAGGLNGLSQTIGAHDENRANLASAQGNINAAKRARPLINDAWNAQNSYWGSFAGAAPQAFNQYQDLANDPYWSTDPVAFNFGKTEQDYIDPALEYRIAQGVRGLDASAAAQGGLFSSGQGRDVTAFAQDEASKEMEAASGRFRQDRAQAYGEYSGMLAERQNRRAQQAGIMGNVASMGMQGLGNLSDQRANYDQSMIGNTQDLALAQGQANAARKANSNMFLRGGLNMLSGAAAAYGGSQKVGG